MSASTARWPLALGALQRDLVIGAGAHARDPGKGVAFHAGHHRVVAQHLLRHAVLAHQFAHQPQHGIVAKAVIEEPGAIAARRIGGRQQDQQHDQAAPQAAIAALVAADRRRWREAGAGMVMASYQHRL